MNYESEVVDLVLPSELIHDDNLMGEIDRRNISSLPHDERN